MGNDDKEEGFFDKLLSIGEGFMDAFEGKQDDKTIAKEAQDWVNEKVLEFWTKTRKNVSLERDITGEEFRLSLMNILIECYRKGGENAVKIINAKK